MRWGGSGYPPLLSPVALQVHSPSLINPPQPRRRTHAQPTRTRPVDYSYFYRLTTHPVAWHSDLHTPARALRFLLLLQQLTPLHHSLPQRALLPALPLLLLPQPLVSGAVVARPARWLPPFLPFKRFAAAVGACLHFASAVGTLTLAAAACSSACSVAPAALRQQARALFLLLLLLLLQQQLTPAPTVPLMASTKGLVSAPGSSHQ